jgi:predicted nucleotidyltransferase
LPVLAPSIQVLLADYRRLLEEHLGDRLVGMLLFGSYARGEARADSDVDVAVIVDRIDRSPERALPMELAGDLVVKYGMVITPLVLSVSELAFLRQREDLLAANLDREGIAI